VNSNQTNEIHQTSVTGHNETTWNKKLSDPGLADKVGGDYVGIGVI